MEAHRQRSGICNSLEVDDEWGEILTLFNARLKSPYFWYIASGGCASLSRWSLPLLHEDN